MKKYLRLIYIVCTLCGTIAAYPQITSQLTLEQAIEIARTHSSNALIARLGFMSSYWSYRSYKAQYLPSLNLNGELGNYNRSRVEARDPETGRINYVANNTMSNDLSLSIDQAIALTGGKISLESSLNRLDQFDYNNRIYNSTPLNLSYTQPLRSFNELKWMKKTEPLRYEQSKRAYIESMEDIAILTTEKFFAVLSARSAYKKNLENMEDTRKMFDIARKRSQIGTIDKGELLQLELALMNAELSVSGSQTDLDIAQFSFYNYIGITENNFYELIPPTTLPDIVMNHEFVIFKALDNSSHNLGLQLEEIEAKKKIAQAKANKGIQMTLKANLGLSKTTESFQEVYKKLIDREIIGVSVSMPIYDWGMSKGKVKMAEAEAQLVRTQNEQKIIEFEQDIRIKVTQFNKQTRQCQISERALEIARESYNITKQRFQNGTITVSDLNISQKELDNATEQYISQLSTFWKSYLEIQKLTHYDFIRQKDLGASFDEMIN